MKAIALAVTLALSSATAMPPHVAAAYDAMLSRRKAFSAALAAHRKSGQPSYTFAFDWQPFLRDVSRQIAAEKDPETRRMLLLSYLDLGFGSFGATLDPQLARRALAEIPPTSRLWSEEPDLLVVALRSSRRERSYAGYVREVIAKHPDPVVRKLTAANASPDRRIMAGKPVPAFRVASLDDAHMAIDSDALRGTVYLIDFWATWCRPCVDEMPNLQRAYDDYRGRGFAIVSLSLDKDRETVAKFRAGTARMPWMNGLLQGGIESEIAKRFELTGIPKPVMVGRDGRIIAVGDELRGPRLGRTLASVVGRR